ncbi:zinc finger protein ubi-d4 isoform X4 [Leptopilina boulardi]|uniref:zinc finger protein ubi-d4 isoform X4 n=1 Tax=Leptopilina boulardi TaxID=63433 RepID=UPI0021F539FC|nr:zinc finger protein ubi-d4 isoform X4 [Leptopilina boulardi]
MMAVSIPPSVHSIIQVVNESNLGKIESFLNDTAYREAIENSSNYNTRLCRERRLRMPFLDSQTGVAQNHSALFMSARERIPGLLHGQIYTYPSKRWRKKRRQYLMHYLHPKRVRGDIDDGIEHVEITSGLNDDSKESLALKDEHSKDGWYYDEQDMLDMEAFDEPDPDSDFDYEESYSSKRKRRKPRGGGHHPSRSHPPAVDSPGPKRTKGGGRGRKKANYDATDADKPFVCDRGLRENSICTFAVCSARYKTRPGLVYHYGHSHSTSSGDLAKELSPSPADVESRSTADAAVSDQSASKDDFPPTAPSPGIIDSMQASMKIEGGGPPTPGGPEKKIGKSAQPSPYCDFCLGDARENKKTGGSEELVSCSDCGRSGHPTCLQFTANMIVSVRKYRWQCIECKCCSICGTSDNDDQLLFCDDCDRGYHMYCLSPPLSSPPEGSWSCSLCLAEFHRRD